MNYSRQMDLLDPTFLRNLSVDMIGCGGTGSATAIPLGKLGVPKLRIFDADVVTDYNLPGQIFRKRDVGRLKVEAMREIVADFSDCVVTPVPEFYNGSKRLAGPVICAIDSMDTLETGRWGRIDLWKKIKYNINIPLYIDARMGAEVLRLYTFNPCEPDAVAKYETTLYSSENAVHAPCTGKSIIYTGLVIGGLIVNALKHFLVGAEFPFEYVQDLKSLQTMIE